MACAALGLLLATQTRGHLALTVACFMVGFAGFKAYLPAFWSLPNIFLAQTAAAGSIGLINSVGNLGGFFGPYLVGIIKDGTGSDTAALLLLGGALLGMGLFALALPGTTRGALPGIASKG